MSEKPRVLWVDDDNDDDRLLAGLMLFFRAAGVEPIRVDGYEKAIQELNQLLSKSTPARSESVTLLTDIVLPQVLGVGALAWDLGLRLAMEAADQGVKRIAFLTVVHEREVSERLKILSSKDCVWRFFSKLELFEGDNIERLVHFSTENREDPQQ